MEAGFTRETYLVLLPLMTLAGGAVAILLAGAFAPLSSRALAGVSLAVQGAATLFLFRLAAVHGEYLQGMLILDAYGTFGAGVVLAVTAAATLLSVSYADSLAERAEFYALLLLAATGAIAMLWTDNLIVVFLGLEMLSIASFILAGFDRTRASSEAALKFLLNGTFSAAFLVLGIALLYGASGSLAFPRIAAAMNGAPPMSAAAMLWAGGAFVAVGLLFKMAVVPFHAWSPDVYQGSPTPVSAFLSAGSKGAAALVFFKFVTEVFGGAEGWQTPLWWVAVVTMFLGNLAALAQTHLKRMLAYSSVAHAGYLLVGILALGSWSRPAVLVYVAAYAAMNVGAFAAAHALEREHGGGVMDARLDDLRGLGWKHPFVSGALALFMFSLAGIPPAVGFAAKLYVFGAALKEGFVGLVVLAVLASLCALYYYLRVIVFLYMKDPEPREDAEKGLPDHTHSPFILAVIVACALATILFGIFPGLLIEWAVAAG